MLDLSVLHKHSLRRLLVTVEVGGASFRVSLPAEGGEEVLI
jgi:hypothetical protein